MAKVNITKPTGGMEAYQVICAFKADGNSYVVFDSEKTGSMGLPIIYISKYINGKLEKTSDDSEWQNVKNYLKGIINGTSFEYIKVDGKLTADEAYYMPLILPQASFDILKSRYVVPETSNEGAVSSATPSEVLTPTGGESVNNQAMPNLGAQVDTNSVMPSPEVSTPMPAPASVAPSPAPNPIPQQNVTTPIMPSNNVESNVQVNSTPVVPTAPTPAVPQQTETVMAPAPAPAPSVEVAPNISNTSAVGSMASDFDSDKVTFLKACENMFDALISKYQKQLSDLESREREIARKEKEIEDKLHNAEEHLANAEAREQVANIAHDNAQRVMDLSNLMPSNPDTNPTGVI